MTELDPESASHEPSTSFELYIPVPIARRTLIELQREARIQEIVSPLLNDVPETVSLEYRISQATIAPAESQYAPPHTIWLRRLKQE